MSDIQWSSPKDAAERAGRNRHRVARRILSLIVVVMLAVEAVLLEPHLAQTGTALTHLHWGWVGVAILAEFASMLYFARLQRRMLRAGGVRVRLGVALATAMAANALSVTLPAGPVVSTGYTFQRMRSWGASGPLATWGMIASGALSTVALAVIGIFGSGVAGGHRPNPIVVSLEIGIAVLAVFLLRRLVRDPERLMHLGEYSLRRVNRLMHKPPQRGQDRVHQVVDELLLIRPRPRDWLLGLNFAILNWVADLVCLLAACRSVGAHGPTVAVGLVAYAAGMAASSISLLPGGLGVVDGTLVLALTRGGLSAALATAAVLVYRLISFVLVAAIGWLAWVILRSIDHRRLPVEDSVRHSPTS